MNLPAEFITRMNTRLGEIFPAFLRSYGLPVRKAIRVNTLKISREEFMKTAPFALEPVPWEKNGFYVNEEKAGAFTAHFAGLYYCQEPSAMCAAPLLAAQAGERVLDLCAAPGGKTTQLAQEMHGRGILVANEYDYDRAKILVQNVERLGVRNCVVVSADAGRLAAALPAFFDKILVDAPCSGEGMFKKEPAAVREWSEGNVRRCAVRQAEILDNAALMLRAGGKLVYSTCTFAEEEDEWQIAEFLKRHSDFSLSEMKKLLPHEVRGEGHFAAVLTKNGGTDTRLKEFSSKISGEARRAFEDFARGFFAVPPAYNLHEARFSGGGDGKFSRLFALPAEMPALGAVRCLRLGLELGCYDGSVFKPSHALAMSVRRGEVKRFVPLIEADAQRFLRGETVESDLGNGWCVAGTGDFPLGIGKIVNGTVKNHLPKGLRKIV